MEDKVGHLGLPNSLGQIVWGFFFYIQVLKIDTNILPI